MAQWVRLCAVADAPTENSVLELEAAGVSVCLANVNGELAALDNICPHRLGPLGQGWVENGAVICPWHAWCFNPKTGVAAPPDKGQAEIFPLRVEAGEILIELADDAAEAQARVLNESA